MASNVFIWVAFINDIAVRMQKSATGRNFTKISTKLITLTVQPWFNVATLTGDLQQQQQCDAPAFIVILKEGSLSLSTSSHAFQERKTKQLA